MTGVLAVTFEPRGQLHYLDPGAETYAVGDQVLYPTVSGSEVAQVVWIAPGGATSSVSFPRCAGPALAADVERDSAHRTVRARAEAIAMELIADHGLAMKVVAVDYLDPGPAEERLVVIYYTAQHRVDFRSLVGELAAALQARVDLRQIGGRDAARVIGGVGSCGRELCCATWMTTIEPVSMRLAKDQQLSTNPLQIAGACGRLKCCLAFEHPLYGEFAERAPAIGTRVETSEAAGEVVDHVVPHQSLTLRTDSGELRSCPLSAVCPTAGHPDSVSVSGEPR